MCASGALAMLGRRILLFVVVWIGVRTAALPAPLSPTVVDGSLDPALYRREWFDNFLGSAIDESKWVVETGKWKGALSDRRNVVLSDGVLHLIGDYNATLRNFTQGRVHSRGYTGPGFFEARLRPSYGNGWHPAFWLAPLNIYPPPFWNQELDIYEMNTYNPSYWTHTFHSWTNGTEYVRRRDDILFWRHNFNVWNMSQNFNTVGCEWTPERVRIYYNGQLFVQRSYPAYVWSNPLQVMLTMALQPWDDPRFPFDFNALPASLRVDYFAYFVAKL